MAAPRIFAIRLTSTPRVTSASRVSKPRASASPRSPSTASKNSNRSAGRQTKRPTPTTAKTIAATETTGAATERTVRATKTRPGPTARTMACSSKNNQLANCPPQADTQPSTSRHTTVVPSRPFLPGFQRKRAGGDFLCEQRSCHPSPVPMKQVKFTIPHRKPIHPAAAHGTKRFTAARNSNVKTVTTNHLTPHASAGINAVVTVTKSMWTRCTPNDTSPIHCTTLASLQRPAKASCKRHENEMRTVNVECK